jgi:hypothetical protein
MGHARSSSKNDNGGLLYTTEMEAGAADEGKYPKNGEVGCAVCSTSEVQGQVFPRWGARQCPDGAIKLYEGFISGANSGHSGGGANYLCMHSSPERPQGYSTANNNGALLYGTEYQNTGSNDKNHDLDAACVMCARPDASETYTQWGRQTCTDGHHTEYSGLVMGAHWKHYKAESICVDYAREPHAKSSAANHNGALLYTTETESGSTNENQYPPNKEVGCAVCSVRKTWSPPPPPPPSPPPAISKKPDCSAKCEAKDHVPYLPREAPAMDQFGASHFHASTKPSTPIPSFRFHFFTERLTPAKAAGACARRGYALARLNTPEKIRAFKSQLATSSAKSTATPTRFEAVYDAIYRGQVYDQTRAVNAVGKSNVMWVHPASSGDRGPATLCGSRLAANTFQQVSAKLSHEHLVKLAGKVLGISSSPREPLPTMCKATTGEDLEFVWPNLIGNFPPYESPDKLVRKEGQNASVAKVEAFCYNCHKDASNAARCASFGDTEGLFASGAVKESGTFNCDDYTLPYACEETYFPPDSTPTTKPSCVNASDLELFPNQREGARFPTFVKQLTFYYGYLPIVGTHPSSPSSGVRHTYITGMDVVMNEPENVPNSKKLSKCMCSRPSLVPPNATLPRPIATL